MTLLKLEARLQETLPDARIETVTLPDCASLRLGLINADYQTGPLAPEVMLRVASILHIVYRNASDASACKTPVCAPRSCTTGPGGQPLNH